MDPDMQSDRELSPGLEDDDWRRERSPTPVFDSAPGGSESSRAKPRKRLVKKGGKASALDHDDDAAAMRSLVGEDVSDNEQQYSSKKRKMGKEMGSERKEKIVKSGSMHDRGQKMGSNGGSSSRSRDFGGDPEMKEMWDTIAGGDSEVNYQASFSVIFFPYFGHLFLFLEDFWTDTSFIPSMFRMTGKVLGPWMMMLLLMIVVSTLLIDLVVIMRRPLLGMLHRFVLHNSLL